MDKNAKSLIMILPLPPNSKNVNTYSNVLPIELISKIEQFANEQKNTRTNYSSWDNAIVRKSNAVIVYDLPETIIKEISSSIYLLIPDVSLIEYIHAMYYKWMPGSYIPWHSDHSWDFALTIYCNKNWDENWGGYFAYKDNSNIACIKPEFNVATRIYTPLEHSVFTTTPDADPRVTIQIFGKYKK